MKWGEYSKKKIEDALKKKKGAIVFMRADWCATCAVLESKVLNDPELEKQIRELDVPVFKADVTNLVGEAKDLSDAIGAKGIPAIVVFTRQRPESPRVHVGVLTKESIKKLIQNEFSDDSADGEDSKSDKKAADRPQGSKR